MPGSHDGIYRRIFSHPEMVEDLLRRFVGGPWLEALDFTTLELVPAHYVSQELEQREDDLVWRLRYRDARPAHWFYVYLLLELQSTVDRFMSLRLMVYLGLFYQHLAAQGELTEDGLLPPVLPLVLYNGEERWWAARDVESLIDDTIPLLATYRPSFCYEIIDEVHVSRDVLQERAGPVAAIFEVEQSRSSPELRQSVHRLLDTLERDELKRIRGDIETWLRRVINPRRFPHEPTDTPRELKESWSMLEQRIKRWEQEFEERGVEKGRRQSLEQVFRKQFRLKFGRDLSALESEDLDEADADRIEVWLELILTAESPASLFENP